MKLSLVHVFFALILLGSFISTDAEARTKSRHRAVSFVNREASIVVDADTGKVLEASKASDLRHPASLTKMMTLYLTFEALDKKQLKLNESMPVSRFAASQAPTNLDLMPSDRLTVEEAIKALVVRSANDAAVVLAEHLGGSEGGFARMMTLKAKALGMKQTLYKNASGLPDARQVTTARDLAVLALALRKHFPQYYGYFNTREFTLNGIEYTTHNHVMVRYPWADGLKTGYIRMSGYNLVTSAKKSNHSLIGVVLGGNTVRARDDKMIALLDDTFDRMNGGSPIQSIAALVKVPMVRGMKADETTEVASADAAPASATPRLVKSEIYDTANNADDTDQPEAEGDAAAPEVIRGGWGVQVGMFGAQKDALFAALQAQKLATQELGSAKVKVISQSEGRAPLHRARIENLSQEQAHNACRRLALQRESCFVYQAAN